MYSPSKNSPATTLRILLVEDSATLRYAMSGYIRDAGHEPVVASSGEAALQMIEHTPFDMIIMDVEMPGLNGFETTRLMREWLGEHWVPIIFVTGKTDDQSVEEGIEVGGDDYLTKPVSPIILKAKIRAMQRIVGMRNQLRAMNDQLEILSQRDSLTYLYNRRTFNELAEQQWALAKRQQKPLSIVMLDIDHFKQFNDTYGHPVGDECLKKVADAVQSSLRRPTDLLARYGGEEFIALLPNTDLDGATLVGENICRAIFELQIPHKSSATATVVTASAGIATCQQTNRSKLSDLIQQADNQLYRAKTLGRNRVSKEETSHDKTLLVAHHDHELLEMISTQLRPLFNIVTAESGEECLELTQSLQPELLLLGMDLSDMAGIKVCEQLRQLDQSHQPDQPQPPKPQAILLMSDSQGDDLVSQARQAGADRVLPTPESAQHVIEYIQPYLS
ncbi:diguanylate cyclase [Pseudomaricurvus sp.]|uniref:diguanylate cyclase n=1 Tax=Pseudomaricurvus sp. TaxID=2004510 RepID=UPI003F6B5D09